MQSRIAIYGALASNMGVAAAIQPWGPS